MDRTVEIEIPVAYKAEAKPPRKRTHQAATGCVTVAMPFVTSDPNPVGAWSTVAVGETGGLGRTEADVRPDRNVFHLLDGEFFGSPAPVRALRATVNNPLEEGARGLGVRRVAAPDGHVDPEGWFTETYGRVREYRDDREKCVALVQSLCDDVRVVGEEVVSRRGEPHLVLKVDEANKRVVLYGTTKPDPGPFDLVGGLDEARSLEAYGERLSAPADWTFVRAVEDVRCDYEPTVGSAVHAVAAYANWTARRLHSYGIECSREESRAVGRFNAALLSGRVDGELLDAALAVGDVLRDHGESAPGSPALGEVLRDRAVDRWRDRRPTDLWPARMEGVVETPADHLAPGAVVVARELCDAVSVAVADRWAARRRILAAVEGDAVIAVHRRDHSVERSSVLVLDPRRMALDGLEDAVVERVDEPVCVRPETLDLVIGVGDLPRPARDAGSVMLDFV